VSAPITFEVIGEDAFSAACGALVRVGPFSPRDQQIALLACAVGAQCALEANRTAAAVYREHGQTMLAQAIEGVEEAAADNPFNLLELMSITL